MAWRLEELELGAARCTGNLCDGVQGRTVGAALDGVGGAGALIWGGSEEDAEGFEGGGA